MGRRSAMPHPGAARAASVADGSQSDVIFSHSLPTTKDGAPQNMLFLCRAILTAALATGSAEALADTPRLGFGDQRCGAWVQNNPASGGVGIFYEQWIFGFLSGVRYADPDHDPLKGLDRPAVMQWLDEFCQQDTAASLQEAAIAFVQAHRP